MPRFNEEFAGAGVEATQSQAKLKWFNATKGFGFVSPVDGTPDAFLHVSVLHRAGLQELGDQAELICEISQGPKGPQVVRILEVVDGGVPAGGRGHGFQADDYGAAPSRSGRRDDYGSGGYDSYTAPRAPSPANLDGHGGPEAELSGTVKWFKADKGFGFITADDSEKDVFVHKSVLRRCGLDELETGQRVQMKVQEVEKGREAVWISAI